MSHDPSKDSARDFEDVRAYTLENDDEATLLEAMQPRPQARFGVFHCADPKEEDATSLYYESIDLEKQ